MLTSYSKRRTRKYDNGNVKVEMVIHEGEITTEKEDRGNKELEDYTCYRRTEVLETVIKLITGNPDEATVTDSLNIELSKDATRTPIDEQKIV